MPEISRFFGGDWKGARQGRAIATHGLLQAAGDLTKRAVLECSTVRINSSKTFPPLLTIEESASRAFEPFLRDDA
jgi:hypothetical protein